MLTRDTRPYDAWHTIHPDLKTTDADGVRRVLVWDPKVGTCLVPWRGVNPDQ